MQGEVMERARGCMVAAGKFFQAGAEDIAQTIELGLKVDAKPRRLYAECLNRKSADPSVVAMTSLIIFYLVRDGVNFKKAVMQAWMIADSFHDPIIKVVSEGLMAAEKPAYRDKLLERVEDSEKLADELSLAIYLNALPIEDTCQSRMETVRRQKHTAAKIMAAGFIGARFGLTSVNAC